MPQLDEYGDVPGRAGNQYATIDTVLPEKNLHVRGTINRGGNFEIWMTTPRPAETDQDDWEAVTQARWDRAFGRD